MLHVNIDNFHLIDIENEIHPSMFTTTQGYDIFILRLPLLDEEEFVVQSRAYVLSENSYLFFDKEKKEFIDLGDIENFHKTLNQNIDQAMKVTLDIFHKIENMEDDFYENKKIQNFNQQWFSYKNKLIRITRLLAKATDEMKKFIFKYKSKQDFLEIHFADLLEHLERTSRNAVHALEKLDALYNFHISMNNEKMNKTIYLLTVISGIFLPLNLIVGFFGMNTTSLPFTKEEYGTHIVVGILFVIVFVLALLIKRAQRLDKSYM